MNSDSSARPCQRERERGEREREGEKEREGGERVEDNTCRSLMTGKEKNLLSIITHLEYAW
jgi:hypothetical protein